MSNTLLLSHFNSNLNADFAKGSKTATTPGTVSIVTGKFSNGASIDGATNGETFYYNELDNIRRDKGTLEFWIKPLVDFAIPPSGGDYRYLVTSNAIQVLTGGLNQPAHGNADLTRITIEVPIGINVNTTKLNSDDVGVWHHYAFTWDKNSGVQVYEDGIRIVNNTTTFTPSTAAVDKIRIGHHTTGQTLRWANAVFDEFRISDNVKYIKNFTAPALPFLVPNDLNELVNIIIKILQDDSRLSAISDDFIYFGDEAMIPLFPSITVCIDEERNKHAQISKGIDAIYNLKVTVYAESVDYQTGLQSVTNHAQNISDVLQSHLTIDDFVYKMNIVRKRYSPGMFDVIPVFACEILVNVIGRFDKT